MKVIIKKSSKSQSNGTPLISVLPPVYPSSGALESMEDSVGKVKYTGNIQIACEGGNQIEQLCPIGGSFETPPSVQHVTQSTPQSVQHITQPTPQSVQHNVQMNNSQSPLNILLSVPNSPSNTEASNPLYGSLVNSRTPNAKRSPLKNGSSALQSPLLLPFQSPFKKSSASSASTQQAVGNRSNSSILSTHRHEIEGRRANSQGHQITTEEYIRAKKAKIEKKMSKVRFTEPFGESIKHMPFKIDNIESSEDDSDSYNESTCCMCLTERQRRNNENKLDEILANITSKSNYIALPEISIDSSIFVNGEVTNPQNAFLTNTFDIEKVLAATKYPLVYILKDSIKDEETTTIEKRGLPRDKKSVRTLEKDLKNFVELYPSLLKKYDSIKNDSIKNDSDFPSSIRWISYSEISGGESTAKKFVRPIKVKVGRKITMDDVDQIVVNKGVVMACNEVSKNGPRYGNLVLGQMLEYSDYLRKPVEFLGGIVGLNNGSNTDTELMDAAHLDIRAIKFKEVTGMSEEEWEKECEKRLRESREIWTK